MLSVFRLVAIPIIALCLITYRIMHPSTEDLATKDRADREAMAERQWQDQQASLQQQQAERTFRHDQELLAAKNRESQQKAEADAKQIIHDKASYMKQHRALYETFEDEFLFKSESELAALYDSYRATQEVNDARDRRLRSQR